MVSIFYISIPVLTNLGKRENGTPLLTPLRSPDFFEDLPERAARYGVPGFGKEFYQGLQGKTAFPEPGMGYLQPGRIGNDQTAKEENVDVQSPFPPAPFPAPVPSIRSLNTMNGLQEFPGGEIPKAGNSGIEKPGLIQHIERLGFDDCRRLHVPQNPAQTLQSPGENGP
jgi:hypothetical protein